MHCQRGFGGFVLEAKYTDVNVRLRSPLLNVDEFTHARGPIPAVGVIARGYIVPNISITGELSMPKSIPAITEVSGRPDILAAQSRAGAARCGHGRRIGRRASGARDRSWPRP